MATRFRSNLASGILAPDSIQTDRLELRKPDASHVPLLFRDFTSDPDVIRFLPFPVHKDISETSALVENWHSRFEGGVSFPYVIVLREDATPIGVIELHPQGHQIAFECNIAKRAQKRGFASEACSAIVTWALRQPAIWRVECLCIPGNLGAARGLQNAGMELEGTARRCVVFPNLDEEPKDCLVFSKTR